MHKSGKIVLWIIWLALLGWGLTGVAQRLWGDGELANYGSYVPWGLWISVYVYFVGMSAGLFLLSTLAYLFNLETYKPLGRVCLFGAMVTLVMGLFCVLLDLGHAQRALAVFTRPNFSSVMTWLVWLYTLYFVLLAIMLRLALRSKVITDSGPGRGPLRVMASITLPVVIVVSGGVGALFATLAGRPYWHSGLFPIMFLIGAVVCGTGLLIFTAALFEHVPEAQQAPTLKRLSLLLLGLIGFYLLMEFAEFTVPMWYGFGAEDGVAREVLFGSYWWVFWIVHVLLGSAIPIVLLAAKPTSRPATAVAGGLVLVTFLAVRLNVVIPGQVTPALKGLEDAYLDQRLSFEYLPSAFEWSLVAFVVALGIAVFHLGRRFLPLTVIE